MIRLKVFRVEQVCFFELSWGRGQQLTAQVRYPETLTQLYETWQQCYLTFYQTIGSSSSSSRGIGSTNIRGRVKSSGTLPAAPIDYRAKLVAAEAAFLAEFYDWLKSRELLELRSQIAQLAQAKTDYSSSQNLNLSLTCEPLALARFPWETWEILGEFGQRSDVRMIRSPANLRHSPTGKIRSGKMRILVILGDETGLSFKAETESLKSLDRLADVQFEGWRVGESTAGLKERIALRLTEETGWDILFFAGHSNESMLTGGELAIAPQTSIFLNEIKPQLLKAKDNGLQFAIFNSCKGLDLANTLMDLGLSQVAIMREPIHNSVAQEFLIQFVQHLVSHANNEVHTVQDSVLAACEYLKLERNLTYPSSYCVPSFFCHPETVPFTPRTIGVSQKLKQLIPNSRQAIALSILSAASLIAPVQDLMLDGRIYVQALYRQATHQIPQNRPKINIVQIDEASLRSGLIPARKINPIDRAALAKIVDQIIESKPNVLAIDYLLDRPMPEDSILAKSLQNAARKKVDIIFGSDLQNDQEMDLSPSITGLNSVMQGHVMFYPGYLARKGLQSQVNAKKRAGITCTILCPFSFLIALTAQSGRYHPPTPGLDLRSQVLKNSTNELKRIQPENGAKILWGWESLGFQPVVDYSIPPDRIYKTTSAADLPLASPWRETIVILAAGDYAEAGIGPTALDKFPMPSAIAHWRNVQYQPDSRTMTGAEIHAYMIDHFLNTHYLINIPGLLFIVPAALFGKRLALGLRTQSSHYSLKSVLFSKFFRNFALGAGIYGVITLQMAIALGVVVPWFFPVLTVSLMQLSNSSDSRMDLQ